MEIWKYEDNVFLENHFTNPGRKGAVEKGLFQQLR
jgi:hypothetical protein